MKIRSLIIPLLLLLHGEAAVAAIETGIYRIKSYNDKYLTENTSSHVLVCSDLNKDNYAQVWTVNVSDNGVQLVNALSSQYVQGQGTFSAQYVTGDGRSTYFTLTEESDNTVTFEYDHTYKAGLHCDNSNNVVEWYVSEDKSKWTLEEVSLSPVELYFNVQAQQAAMMEASTTDLLTYFTSTACTALNSTYASKTDDDLRSDMSSLPTAAQDMAVKVKNAAWATYDGWNKTEQTFRIADYLAYSSAARWTSILGYSHQFARLTNPTGIYAASGEYLYVYVGAVPSGQSVHLEVAGYGQAAGSVYDLHEGMNVLLMASSGNCFVAYEVDNTTAGAEPYTPIADYAPVTVHIEGGTVQGYFDQTRGDTNADWAQMQTHLMSKETVCLKTKTHVMNLNRDLLVSALGEERKVVEMLNVWTAVAEMEDHLSGRDPYADYCNNVYSVTSLVGDGHPHATSYGTYYYEAAHAGIFNVDRLLTEVGGLWTIAHEQGHNRQGLIKLAGTTEMSNNVFSNAALDWQGRFTARVNGINQTYERWRAGYSWLQRVGNDGMDGTWECLHMYTQLYQYFHQAGRDTDFYPRLFAALRTSPMTQTAGIAIPATEDYLKFYQACCDAAQLDLTEFFEVYGFFTLPTEKEQKTVGGVDMGTRYQVISDYSTYYVYVTQTMIDEAKAAVKAKNNPPCNIIFIEDRVTAPLATYEGHAEGALRQLSMQDNVTAFGQVGDVGQWTDFVTPTATPGTYAYNVNADGIVTVSGTGAVGFKVYDADCNLVGLYNTTTFRLPAEAYGADGLKSGYTIKTAAADGTDAATTFDAGVTVEVFPDTDTWYTLCTTLRGNRYLQCNGAGEGVTGTQSNMADLIQWRFILRDGTLDEYDIVSRYDGSYLNPVAEWNTQLTTVAAQPSAGWKLGAAEITGMYIIYSGSTQVNQTNLSGYPVYNYGSGTTTNDTGCEYTIKAVTTTVSMNAVGEASYSTYFGAGDVRTDATTVAYYVPTVDSGSARLTPVDGDGHDIPARTAVVLVGDKTANTATLTPTVTPLTAVVSESTNLLKGTLTSMTLDLADTTPYYSLGRKDGNIGFYKFSDSNGSSVITLAANKASLDTTASTGVKGFTLSFGGEDGIEEVPEVNALEKESMNSQWTDLNGRRLSGMPTAKGIYIMGGRKVVVK